MKEYSVLFYINNIKKGETEGQLRVIVRWKKGKSYVTNVGYKVDSSKWDRDLQICSRNSFHGRRKTSSSVINNEIKRFRIAIESAAQSFPIEYYPTKEEFKDRFNEALGKEIIIPESAENVDALLAKYILKVSVLKSWAHNTERNYGTLRRTLKEWKKDLTIGQLDKKGLEEFYLYLVKKGYANSTIEKHLCQTKAFLTWCEDAGISKNVNEAKKFAPVIKVAPKDVIWLNWEELELLRKADLSTSKLRADCHAEEIRDLYLFSCYTGMRYSDLQQIRHSDIKNDLIDFIILKTGDRVCVELNNYSRSILKKYKDYHPVYALPQLSNVNCNKRIKEICKHAGICSPVTISSFKGSVRTQIEKPKYKLITMHTGRKTFICNALDLGISPVTIMQWTGHKDYHAMKPYIAISDKAKRSAMDLFNKKKK